MVHLIDIQRTEDIINYHFSNQSLVRKALQAPIKIQDKITGAILHLDDGNRRLAQLGHKVLELVLADFWYHAGSDRGWTLLHASNDYLANIAKRKGIDTCMTCCDRQGDSGPSPKTLKLGVTALIGAVWLDSHKDVSVVSQVIEHLGITLISGD